MIPYTQNMNQTATYWPFVSVDEYNRPSYGAPVAIKCRWQNKADLFRTTEGEQMVSQAVVYPDRELARKGYLFRGTSTAADPRTVDGAAQIIQIGDSPSLDGQRILHKVWL